MYQIGKNDYVKLIKHSTTITNKEENMGIRRLLLYESKGLDISEKKELTYILKEYDRLKDENKILEGKYRRTKKQKEELEVVVDMYKNCVTDMASDMAIGGTQTAEFYQEKYESKWIDDEGGKENE